MTRIALLVTVLAFGCDNSKPEERKLPGSAAPPTATPAPAPATPPTPGSAGSAGSAATPEVPAPPKGTGFAPFDDAIAGTRPWIAIDDKAGIVELHAVEDLSGRTPGKFITERRCGADAAKVVEAIGKRIAERTKEPPMGRGPVQCKEEGGVTSCVQPGVAEGDANLEIEYAKAGDAWRVIGVKTYAVGVTMDKLDAKYAELLKQPCK
jgi:hypothetical protein